MTLDIDALLSETAQRHDLPSIVLGISRNGVLRSTHAVGAQRLGHPAPPDADSVYRIASMTKSFTAAAVLLLRDRGQLHLDDEVVRLLPWFDDPRVSVRDLLTMNAGFPTDDPWGDRHEPTSIADFDALVASGVRRIRPARTGFEYSNLGYALLGRVITAVTGRDYTEFLESEIVRPSGLTATVFDARRVSPEHAVVGYAITEGGLREEPAVTPGAFSPMGGLHSSLRDLTAWVAGFLDAAEARTLPHPLAADSRVEQQEPHAFARMVVRTDPIVSASSLSYGFGLLVEEHSVLGRFVVHSGGYPGFGSNMRWHPRTGLAVVALSNRTYAPMYPLAEQVLASLVEDEGETNAVTHMWPETRAAMDAAESLLRCWDDAIADRHFAHNLDLDQVRAERRSTLEALASSIGPFERDSASVISRTPAHARWLVRGTAGAAWVEVLMSPDPLPRIQTLRVESGPA